MKRILFLGLACFLRFGTLPLFAQADPPKASLPPVDVDFLFHYYEQEGIHSAVTGGTGTEELRDISSVIVVNVPMDSVSRLLIQSHFNNYSSASTDKIDTRVSSASAKDNRAALQFTYSRQDSSGRKEWGVGAGASIESDYISTSLSGHWRRSSADDNQEISLSANLFLDTWIVYYPEELRGPGLAAVDTDKRRSLALAATYRQVVNPRLHFALTAEWAIQQGLLSTPFHRVYFQGESLPRIEKMPGWRLKFPLGLRLNYSLSDRAIVRTYQRLYYDTFDVRAYTADIETPVRLTRFFAVYPFYRYHRQSAARFFQPYSQHQTDASWYTSDYDLSAFQSHKYGVGLHFSPVYGIGRIRLGSKKGLLKMEEISLRYGQYRRSDGLRSFVISGEMGFLFE